MLFSKTVVAAAIIASTQAAVTGEGTFAGSGYAKYVTEWFVMEFEGETYRTALLYMDFGAKDVTFTDKTDFTVESVWCLPNGITDKFYCAMATIADPLGAKTLTINVWQSTAKVTFTENESLATTLGAADVTATYTDNTTGDVSGIDVSDTVSITINDKKESFTDATDFTIPIVIQDSGITADTFGAFEEDFTAKFNEFWGATQIYTGTDGTRTTVQGDKEKLA